MRMSTNSESSLMALLTLLVFLFLMEMVSSAKTASAMHFVPPTSSSIKRFPADGSPYAGKLAYFRSFAMNPNGTKLVVAARDYVFQLDLESFELKNSSSSINIINLKTGQKSLSRCERNRKDKTECHNYMLLVAFRNPNTIFACGTYSLSGRCWEIPANTFQDPKLIRGEFSDSNVFAPQSSDGSVIAHAAGNKVLIAAVTNFQNVYTTFSLRGLLPSGRQLQSKDPSNQFTSPTFISTYEADDGFIYFFFTETAVEVAERQMIYSRIGRVCSYDTGAGFDKYDTFVTFLKSQIVCYKKGRVPDYYDHIQSVTAVKIHDENGKSEVYIYASFTTTIRSTGSSAICRYKLKDIQKLFQTSQYYVRKTENGKTKYEPQNHPKPALDVGRMKCDKSLNTESIKGKELFWGDSNPLLFEDNVPYDKTSVVTFRGERVTAVAVEDIHEKKNKTDVGRHVIFAGTDSGKIYKVVINSTNVGNPVFVEEIQAVEESGAITRLDFYKDYLIASGPTIRLLKVRKERCESTFLLCNDCVKSRDPYCAWSLSQKKCTSAVDLPLSDRIQNISTGNDEMCPPVDVHVSCSIQIVDDIPGARTALQCTGYGKLPPKVLAWKRGDTILEVDNGMYEIEARNVSSQILIIRDYSNHELGTYECVVGIGRNRSFCPITITGIKPNVNCYANASNCSCGVSGYPFPIIRKVVNGNETIKVQEPDSFFIQPGELLLAINSFGDDAFLCQMEAAPATTSTTTLTSTTKKTTTTTTVSTTETSSTTNATTPVVITTGSTTKPTTEASTVTKKTTTATTPNKSRAKTSTNKAPETTKKPSVTPGQRKGPEVREVDKYRVPFFICLALLIIFVPMALVLLYLFISRRQASYDDEDEFDGKKGTLNISASKNDSHVIPMNIFRKRKKVRKTDSTKPLVKKKNTEPKNGCHSPTEIVSNSKQAKEMDYISTVETL